MSDRKLLVDLHGMVVGSTFSTADDGLYRAVHPTTGEDWGLVAVRPLGWTRRRVYVKDLETFRIQDAGPLDKTS
jgi:hypothetical protein